MAFLWSWIFVIPLIVLSTAFFGVVSFVISLFDHTPPRQLKVARAWARSLLRIAGVKVTVEGLDRIQPGGNYVFVSNHVSYMDIPVVLGNIPEAVPVPGESGIVQDSLPRHASQDRRPCSGAAAKTRVRPSRL